ncbi:MAG: hypothetical protein ABSF69_07825 [Polyangiaceae bacterium]|jgi:hypothetical protein
MSELRDPSHPPSDPYGSPARRRAMTHHDEDRPVRVQLIAALLVGLVLISSGLYLWRRPPGMTTDGSPAEAVASALAAASDGGTSAVEAGSTPVMLSEARIVGCHDRGPRVTSPEECDHVASIERALSQAIQQSLACVPAADSSGTIEYVADVSFSRRKVRIRLPRSGRSFRDQKTVVACRTAVGDAMRAVELEGIDHRHARYEIAITATYRGKT